MTSDEGIAGALFETAADFGDLATEFHDLHVSMTPLIAVDGCGRGKPRGGDARTEATPTFLLELSSG